MNSDYEIFNNDTYKCIKLSKYPNYCREDINKLIYHYDCDILFFKLYQEFLNYYHYTVNNNVLQFKYKFTIDCDAVANINIKFPVQLNIISIDLCQYKQNDIFVTPVQFKYLPDDLNKKDSSNKQTNKIILVLNNPINISYFPEGTHLHFNVKNIIKINITKMLEKIRFNYEILFTNSYIHNSIINQNIPLSL